MPEYDQMPSVEETDPNASSQSSITDYFQPNKRRRVDQSTIPNFFTSIKPSQDQQRVPGPPAPPRVRAPPPPPPAPLPIPPPMVQPQPLIPAFIGTVPGGKFKPSLTGDIRFNHLRTITKTVTFTEDTKDYDAPTTRPLKRKWRGMDPDEPGYKKPIIIRITGAYENQFHASIPRIIKNIEKKFNDRKMLEREYLHPSPALWWPLNEKNDFNRYFGRIMREKLMSPSNAKYMKNQVIKNNRNFQEIMFWQKFHVEQDLAEQGVKFKGYDPLELIPIKVKLVTIKVEEEDEEPRMEDVPAFEGERKVEEVREEEEEVEEEE